MQLKQLLLVLLFPLMVFSQENQPKIGLVLSGGGAKGFAHIGVLKEIDKAGIKIDYIGGTSMGSIIGALYASGYTGEQIEKLVLDIDFTSLMQDLIPRNAKPYFDKEFGEHSFFTLPVKNGVPQLPTAISKGQNILDLFSRVLQHVDDVKDFSKLPIPFFCVATNAETGDGVLLESGSLPMAIRASGSFPTLLSPVTIDGKLLIDGGIVNNFPADIMKAKGMDYIIGVDVQGELLKKNELNSVVELLNQIAAYKIFENSSKAIRHVNVHIKPNIEDYSVISFEKTKEIIDIGNKEALKFTSIFDSISSLQPEKRELSSIKTAYKKEKIKEIKVIGAKRFTSAFVKGRLNLRVGDSICKLELNDKIKLLSATENYDRIEYELKNNIATIKVLEKKDIAKIRLGAHFDQLYQSALLANYINKSLLIANDELSVDIIVGDRIRYNLNYFVDNGFYLSYGFKSRYNHFRTNAPYNPTNIAGINKIDISYSDITNQIFVQTTFNRMFALGLGFEQKTLKITTDTFNTPFRSGEVFDKNTYLDFFTYLKLDTYDDKNFPTKGFYVDLGAKWFFSSTDKFDVFDHVTQLNGRFGFATSMFKNTLTLKYQSDAGFTISDVENGVFDYFLGGNNQNYINTFVPMYGYEFGSLSEKSYIKSEIQLRCEIFKNNHLSFIANYARLENNVFKNAKIFDDIRSGYALGYSIDSFIGPIEIKYAWSPDHKENFWHFNLGFWF